MYFGGCSTWRTVCCEENTVGQVDGAVHFCVSYLGNRLVRYSLYSTLFCWQVFKIHRVMPSFFLGCCFGYEFFIIPVDDTTGEMFLSPVLKFVEPFVPDFISVHCHADFPHSWDCLVIEYASKGYLCHLPGGSRKTTIVILKLFAGKPGRVIYIHLPSKWSIYM